MNPELKIIITHKIIKPSIFKRYVRPILVLSISWVILFLLLFYKDNEISKLITLAFSGVGVTFLVGSIWDLISELMDLPS